MLVLFPSRLRLRSLALLICEAYAGIQPGLSRLCFGEAMRELMPFPNPTVPGQRPKHAGDGRHPPVLSWQFIPEKAPKEGSLVRCRQDATAELKSARWRQPKVTGRDHREHHRPDFRHTDGSFFISSLASRTVGHQRNCASASVVPVTGGW